MSNQILRNSIELSLKTVNFSAKKHLELFTRSNKKKPLTAIGLLACMLSLSSCQSIPPVDDSTVVARPNIPVIGDYEYLAAQQTGKSLASMRWQSYYSDPKLKTLIELGLENNKDVRQAILAIQKARAQYQITDKNDLPVVSGSGSYERSANNRIDANPSSGYNVGLAASSYELDFWGKISSLKDQALQNFLATTAAKDSAQISLIANIATSYVNLSYQLKQLELANKTLESRLDSLRITTARLKAGIDSKQPSLQALASVETARIAQLEAQTALLQARNALKYLVGVPITDELLPQPAVGSIVSPEVFTTGLPSEILRYRPDVLQAEYRLKAAGANIDVARAEFYPSISLTGRLGYSSSDLSDLFKSSAVGWSFGPSVSVPIFSAGQLQGNYEVAQIEQQEALANYESTIENAFYEVNDVLAERETLQQRIDARYRLQDTYAELFEVAEARYIAQIDDYLSVLDAQRAQFATQQSIVDLERRRLLSQIELYQRLGGGANLVEPIAIPTPEYTNLANIGDLITPDSPEAVAAEAIQAASSANVVSANKAEVISANNDVTLIEHGELEPVDIDEDNQVDAFLSEIKTTVLPAHEAIELLNSPEPIESDSPSPAAPEINESGYNPDNDLEAQINQLSDSLSVDDINIDIAEELITPLASPDFRAIDSNEDPLTMQKADASIPYNTTNVLEQGLDNLTDSPSSADTNSNLTDSGVTLEETSEQSNQEGIAITE